MSHFTRIKTQMVEAEHIKQALEDLGYSCQQGDIQIRGHGGQRTSVELKVSTESPGYDIGFRRAGKGYEMVADWWGIHGVNRDQFLQQVTQRYAYNTVRTKLEKQGFDLVTEETQQSGQIHLRLRRME